MFNLVLCCRVIVGTFQNQVAMIEHSLELLNVMDSQYFTFYRNLPTMNFGFGEWDAMPFLFGYPFIILFYFAVFQSFYGVPFFFWVIVTKNF